MYIVQWQSRDSTTWNNNTQHRTYREAKANMDYLAFYSVSRGRGWSVRIIVKNG